MKKNFRRCMVPGCANNLSINLDAHVFRFPCNTERQLEWIVAVSRFSAGIVIPSNLEEVKNYGTKYICTNHFLPSNFNNEQMRKLNRNSVPSVFDATRISPPHQVKPSACDSTRIPPQHQVKPSACDSTRFSPPHQVVRSDFEAKSVSFTPSKMILRECEVLPPVTSRIITLPPPCTLSVLPVKRVYSRQKSNGNNSASEPLDTLLPGSDDVPPATSTPNSSPKARCSLEMTDVEQCPTEPCPTEPCLTEPCLTEPCLTEPCPTEPCPTSAGEHSETLAVSLRDSTNVQSPKKSVARKVNKTYPLLKRLVSRGSPLTSRKHRLLRCHKWLREIGNNPVYMVIGKLGSTGSVRSDHLNNSDIPTKGGNISECRLSDSNCIEPPSSQSINVQDTEHGHSEGIIRYVVPTPQQLLQDENARMVSPVEYINNLPWKIMIQRKDLDLGVFLCLHGPEYDPNYKVYAEFSFRLIIKQERSSLCLLGSGEHEFRRGGTGHGFPHFANASKLLTPADSILKEGDVVIECHVACSSPLKVIKVSARKDATLQTFMKANGFSVDYLAERAKYILENCVGSDCEFVVNGMKERKRASKAILARVSPVFERMFFKSGKGCDVYRVLDISADTFDVLLRHIYGVGWEFQSKLQASQLLYAARKYELKDLQAMCIRFMWPTTLYDVWVALDCAVRYDIEDLQEAAMEILRRNASEAFKTEQFINISLDCLVLILKQTKLNVSSEIEVFDAALRWASAKKEVAGTEHTLRSVLGEAVKYIRFLSMTKEQFSCSPCQSGVLTQKEKADVLQRLTTKKKEPLFVELSGITSPRETA